MHNFEIRKFVKFYRCTLYAGYKNESCKIKHRNCGFYVIEKKNKTESSEDIFHESKNKRVGGWVYNMTNIPKNREIVFNRSYMLCALSTLYAEIYSN